MKKIFTSLLAVLLVFACLLQFPVTAEAASTVDSDTYNGITWKVTSDRTLTLSGKGPIEILEEDRDEWNAPWDDYGRYIQKIVIKSGITGIGESTLDGYKNVKSISIPKTVTYIGINAFGATGKLTKITIPKGVVSIGRSAFFGCEKLKTIKLPSTAVDIGKEAFHVTAWYKEAARKNRIVYLDKILYSVPAIEEADTENMPKGKVTVKNGTVAIVEGAFFCCSDITALSLPSTLRHIGPNAFGGCAKLKSVTIPKGVTCIEAGAFSGCVALKSVSIPKTVKTIDYGAFSGCTSLRSITIPKGVTTIGGEAFAYCENLSKISIPSTVTTVGEDAFKDTDWLDAQLPRSIIYVGKIA